MSDSEEESVPMIECVLMAPTATGITEGSPTLTNLDRSTFYNLILKKLNEKIDAGQLNVSIRLGLNPNFTKEFLEKEMFNNWKTKHLFERLIEIIPADDSFKKDGNKIIHNQDSTSTVHLEWNQKEEINLLIRFNCASSQFPFKRDLSSWDAIFVLVIRIVSKNTQRDIVHDFCQIRLFWPGLAREANDRMISRKHESCQSNPSYLPSSTVTLLRPYDQNKKLEMLDPKEYMDDFLFNELEIKSFSGDYGEISSPCCMTIDNYLKYILRDPLVNYVDDGAGFKGIFIEHNDSFRIEMRQSSETDRVSFKQIVRTRFELRKSDSPFVDGDLDKWSRTTKRPIIEIDYESSHFTFKLLDIRIIKENLIEIFWLPSKMEVVIAFKINCFSKKFCPNQPELLPLGKPFNFRLKSFIVNRNKRLETGALQIYTTHKGSAEYMKEIWSQKNANFAQLIEEDGSPSIIILNDQNLNLNKSNVNLNEPSIFGTSIGQILLVLLATLLIVSMDLGKFVFDGVDQQKLDTELKRFGNIDTTLEQLFNTVDNLKNDQNKFEAKLKKQVIADIEKYIFDKLDFEMKTRISEPDYQKIDEIIQKKFDDQLQSQTEDKLDMKMIEKIIKDKINTDLKNISSIEFENFNKNVQDKVKLFEQNVHESLKNVSIDSTIDKTIRERVEVESTKIQKFINEKYLEISRLIDQSIGEESDENVKTAQNGSSVLEYVLLAPTAAGIPSGYSSLTNLDRSKWYELQLKKLDQSLDTDKLLVSFQLKLNLIKSSKGNLFNQWKALHPSERIFDLEYAESGESDSNDNNHVILDNNNMDSDSIDMASFYWNQKQMTKLRIRFNFVHNQFPFKKSRNSKDVTFILHVKVSSLTETSGTVIDNSFCQIKLFWPDGASVANHKANKMLQQTKHYGNFEPASPKTKLTFYYSKMLEIHEFIEDKSFVEKLNSLMDSTQDHAIQATKNYLHYILIDPANSFANVTTNDGNQVKAFFLEQNKSFTIKLLPNAKTLPKLSNSIVRIRFELNTNGRAFTEQELINWSASKPHPMIEIAYLRSKLHDTVYDIRQIDVNCIEIIWLPNADQSTGEFTITFNINSNENEQFLLKINTFMTKNGCTISSLDSASSGIFITENGEAENNRKTWLQQNSRSKTDQSAVHILNDPNVNQSKQRQTFNINFTNIISIISSLIIFIVRWAVRTVLTLMVCSFVVKNYRNGLSTQMSENVAGLLIGIGLILMIVITFYV